MELIKEPLGEEKTSELEQKYGDYLKLTVDLNSGFLVAGAELHADGEAVLLKEGGRSENIWGGGINLVTKEIDATAVLNLRPNLENASMEILDPVKRDKFMTIVKKIFKL